MLSVGVNVMFRVAGQLAKGLRDVLAYWLRYQAQTYGYIALLTGRYPSFSDE